MWPNSDLWDDIWCDILPAIQYGIPETQCEILFDCQFKNLSLGMYINENIVLKHNKFDNMYD